jgi:hypothetical protein
MTIREEETSNIASEPVDVAQEPPDVAQEPTDAAQKPVDVEQDPVDVEQDPTDVEQSPVDADQGPEPIDMFDLDVKQEPIDVAQEESKDEEFVDEEAPPMKSPGATSIDGPGADPAEKKGEEPQDPALEKEQAKKPKKEINPNFKEFHETGKWGQISRTEMSIVLAVVLAVVVGVIVAIVVATGNNDSEDTVIAAPPRAVVPDAPTAAPIPLALEDVIDFTLRAIDLNGIVYIVGTDDLPELDSAAYVGLQDDPTEKPARRAMSWLLFSDGRNVMDETVYRWALASIYYSMGGENWPKQQNWLSDESICEWHGLDCNAFGVLTEIDLSENNLVGQVPLEFAMLETLQAVALRENQLSGELNGEIFGYLPRLTILYLENNKFVGAIPASLRNNGVLRKLSVCLMISVCWILLLSHGLVDSIQFISSCRNTLSSAERL